MREYDVFILGAGGGGYPAAFQLARAGRQVLMVDDKGNLGGHCLFEGCIPSKTVRESAEMLRRLRSGGHAGVNVREAPVASWSSVRAYKDGVQTRRYAQHAEEIARAANLTVVQGRGRFTGTDTAEIFDAKHSDVESIRFRAAIVATGSSERHLEIPGLGHDYRTSHDFFAWREALPTLPRRLLIVGGGYIGVELAMMLAPFDVDVTVVEAMDSILPAMDPDLRTAVGEALERTARVRTNSRVEEVHRTGAGYVADIHTPSGMESAQVDEIVVAVGRVPNVGADLGLDRLGIAYDAHGIRVDRHMRTTVPHIYATGDVTALSMLFHSAVRMSHVAANNLLAAGEPVDHFVPEHMPQTVFSFPEAQSVGLTRAQAEARGRSCREVRRAMGVEARAQIAGETEGFIKFVVENGTDRILGVHGFGFDSAQLSAVSQAAVHLGLTLSQLAGLTFPHPTQFEIFDRLARDSVAAYGDGPDPTPAP